MVRKPPRLELDDDRKFQNRFWIFERVAWLFLAAIVIVALLGLTGQGGPLARATAEGPGGSVDYPRVTRWETSDDLVPATTGSVTIGIDAAFAEIFEIEDIQPAPSGSVVTPRGQELTFDLAESPGRKTITVHIRAMHPELFNRIGVRIGESPELMLTPIVLP